MNRLTEFEFTLPVGYVDPDGSVHKQGVMRMATAMDEIAPLRDLRVRANQAYLAIVLLARVIVKLGTLPNISTTVIENLYVADLAYLQALYRQINEEGKTTISVACPECQAKHEVDLATLGGS
ncbi:MAG TPA: hypothetical protein VJL59_22430 [Anaerolineales bacterium]|nr:hypothetical protein [Anaerolineales bacterium]